MFRFSRIPSLCSIAYIISSTNSTLSTAHDDDERQYISIKRERKKSEKNDKFCENRKRWVRETNNYICTNFNNGFGALVFVGFSMGLSIYIYLDKIIKSQYIFLFFFLSSSPPYFTFRLTMKNSNRKRGFCETSNTESLIQIQSNNNIYLCVMSSNTARARHTMILNSKARMLFRKAKQCMDIVMRCDMVFCVSYNASFLNNHAKFPQHSI